MAYAVLPGLHGWSSRLAVSSFGTPPARLRLDRSSDTASHMKTTVQIPDPLVTRAKAIARREGTTLAALVEEGLRTVVKARDQRRSERFELRDASVSGEGVNPDFDLGWDAVRGAIYEGRGG